MPNNALTPPELVRAWFERVWNQGDLSAIDDLLPPHAIAHGLTSAAGEPVRGPAGFKAFTANWRAEVPDIHIAVLRTVTEGSYCSAHCLVTGTHRGGSAGVSATGAAIRFEGVVIVRVENGQFLEGWNFFDFLTYFQSIGALPKLPGQL
jgi:predicted ester cyclase